jgi:hypothetical protein
MFTICFPVNFERAEGCSEGSRFKAFAIDQATFALGLVWPKRLRATERLRGKTGGSRERLGVSFTYWLLERKDRVKARAGYVASGWDMR